ncbi:MAG TPA: arylesterase [Gemmatimonadaceae bacterium]|nr:arylesterase [Gemmatimonadaceae bacterium]
MLSCFALAWVVAGCGKSDGGAADSRGQGSVPSAAAERSSGSEPSTNRSGDERPTIVFVGTSLTAGLGLTDPDEAYPALIQEKIDSLGLNYRVVNAGVSGETSAGALKSIGWLMRSPANVVVIETGANDGLRGLGVDAMRANIQGIIDTVRAKHPDARIVIAGMEAPPNLGARYTSEFREVFPELARANHAALIPFLLEGVAGVDSLNQGDGIHPNREGAQVVADNVWEVLLPVLERGAKSTAGSGL